MIVTPASVRAKKIHVCFVIAVMTCFDVGRLFSGAKGYQGKPLRLQRERSAEQQ